MTDEQYNRYPRVIEMIKGGHTAIPSGILNQAISLYSELTGQSICNKCDDQIGRMIAFLFSQIRQYEVNKNINL